MSIKRNLIQNTILTGTSILFPLIVFPYVIRTLSPENYGKIAFVDAFTQYFIIFSSIGIPYYGIREIARRRDDKESASQLVIDLVRIQVFLSLLFSAIFLLLPFFVPKISSDPHLIYTGCAYVLCSAFSIEWFYQGMEQFGFITRRTILIKIVTAAAIFLLVKSPSDYVIYYLLTVLSVLCNGVVNFGYFLKHYYKKNNGKPKLLTHAKPLLILFSMNVSITVYTLLDSIILGLLKTPADVSMYSVPLKFMKAFWTFGASISIVMVSRMSKMAAGGNKAEVEELIRKSCSLVFLLTIPFAVLCQVCPKEILALLAGKQYIESYNTLRLLGFVPLIIGICNVFGTQFLLPIGKEKNIFYATIGGLVVSLVFNFALVPSLSFIGTSISCVLAELTVMTMVMFYAKKYTSISFDYKLLLQLAISSGTTILFYIAFRSFVHDVFLLGGCTLVFGFTFLLTQVTFLKNAFISSMLKLNLRKAG